MAVITARKLTGYAEISEQVLAETSIIRQVSNGDGVLSETGTQAKVYVNEIGTVEDYVPGTGITPNVDGSAYVTVSNFKERGVNEILDGYTVESAPADYVVSRFTANLAAAGEDDDTIGFLKMVADGTEAVAAVAAKPVVGTIYADILVLKLALDEAKAPQMGRSLILTPEMHNLMLQVDSKVILNTVRGDSIQASGWVGSLLGFQIYVTTLLPTGTNIVALQARAFFFKELWVKGVSIVSLDGSANYYGDSAIKGRFNNVSGAIRPLLLQINNGAA